MVTAIQIADEVVEEIRCGFYSQPIAVSRKVMPTLELKNLLGIMAAVTPKSVETTRMTRSEEKHRFSIDVAVIKKAEAGEDLDVLAETMCGLVLEVRDELKDQNLSEAVFISATIDPVYSVDHLQQNRVFLSVIRLEYEAVGQ